MTEEAVTEVVEMSDEERLAKANETVKNYATGPQRSESFRHPALTLWE